MMDVPPLYFGRVGSGARGTIVPSPILPSYFDKGVSGPVVSRRLRPTYVRLTLGPSVDGFTKVPPELWDWRMGTLERGPIVFLVSTTSRGTRSRPQEQG